MTINQCNWAALQHVPCPAANASTSELHIMLQNVSGTLERSNQIQSFPAFLSVHLPLFSGQFEFEMHFPSIWVQRLPLIDNWRCATRFASPRPTVFISFRAARIILSRAT
jgi:hypothetical protein